MTEKLKIVHIISNLDSGGAEMMLYKLIVAMDAQRFESEVISLTDLGEVGPLLQARGVKVWTLDMGRTFPNPFTLVGLVRHLRQSRPDLVQTWMYHADLLGSIAARCAGSPPVVWGIHHNDVQPRMHKRRTLWVIRTCARFSGLPAHIVCCSAAAQRLHVKLGYPGDKIEIIPNGFDLDEFKPDPSARAQLLRELGLTDEAVLIGLPSRYHPL